jgi:replicative DNA helicase
VSNATWNHSEQSEQSVLGGLLLDNSALDKVGDLLAEGDFYFQAHRPIFRQIQRLIEAGKPADVLTVVERLQAHGELEAVGGAGYVSGLAVNTPSAANIRRYAEIVRERSVLREVYGASTSTIEDVTASNGKDATDVLDAAQSRLLSIRDRTVRGRSDFITVREAITSAVEFIDEQYQRGGNDVVGIPTGFVDFDRMTTGMEPGQLIILAGRPSMGKSALAVNILEHAARATNKWGVMFSLEMGGRELAMRMLASEAAINMQRLKVGRITDEDWKRLSGALATLETLPVAINEAPGLTIMQLRSLARRAKRERGDLSLIVVDYLQLMPGASEDANRATQLSDISRGLKLLAKELDVPIIALSQLNRELEKRTNKRPIMSDLRDSGAIEQDADMILFVYRDEVYHPESADAGSAELIVAKQRNGPIGTVRLAFFGQHARFSNYRHEARA